MNKKVYEFTLVKDSDGSNDYRSRIGFNLYTLPINYYTVVIEFSPPDMTNLVVTAQGTAIYINNQVSKNFTTSGNVFSYVKLVVQFHKSVVTEHDYLFINMHRKVTSFSNTGYMIIYGIEVLHGVCGCFSI